MTTDTVEATELTKAQKIDAEIAKLIAETAKISAETSKINEELAKTRAETAKINKETVWYPLLIATGFVGAIIALTKIFL